MLTISGRSLGRRKPLFADFSVPPPPVTRGDGGITLRALIAATVRHEVQQFRERQSERQFVRVLTEREIADGEAAGRIDSGGSDVPVQKVDEAVAVETAIQAFEDGIYLVSIDDQEQRNLDAAVFLNESSRITFIRLTLLAGG